MSYNLKKGLKLFILLGLMIALAGHCANSENADTTSNNESSTGNTGNTEPPEKITYRAYLKAWNNGDGDRFGNAIAISNDIMVVGANREDSSATGVVNDASGLTGIDNNSLNNPGSAYVYKKNSSNEWEFDAYLKPSDTTALQQIGFNASVAIDGNTIVLGAPLDDAFKGAAYVFVKGTNGNWTQQAKIPPATTEKDQFGSGVDISGDTIAVSAWSNDSNAGGIDPSDANNDASGSGAVYIYTRSGTSWTKQVMIKASNPEKNDNFGRSSLAIDGNTLVVGAYKEDSNGTSQADNSATSAGAAYVFVRSGSTWSQQAYLKAAHPQIGALFGHSVAIEGDTIVIGADGESSSATGVNGDQTKTDAPKAGAAFVFTRTGTTWTQKAYLKAGKIGADTNDAFGASVAISGDFIVVGAKGDDSDGKGAKATSTFFGVDDNASSSGAVFLFKKKDGSYSQVGYLKAGNTAQNNEFGYSVAISGELIAVGAPKENSNSKAISNTPNFDYGVNDGNHDLSGAAYIYKFLSSNL